MRFSDLLGQPEITSLDTGTLRRLALNDNLRRGRVLARAIIAFDTLFLLLTAGAAVLRIGNRFNYTAYMIMYGLMILAGILFLTLSRDRTAARQEPEFSRLQDYAVLGFGQFILIWGSVLTLIDQKLYGQLTVFMINLTLSAVIFILDWKRQLVTFAPSVLIMIVGLPFCVTGDVLIGHYVNLAVFIIIAWMASRLLSQAYNRDRASRKALSDANQQLSAQNTEIQSINDQLVHANLQLHQLSLIDELTGIANRRGLRNFISQVFESDGPVLEQMSAILLDIDNFKLFNDHYGHPAGDQVLTAIAGVLAAQVSLPRQIAARWGGEEFIMIAFGEGSPDLARKAEDIRSQIEQLQIAHDYSPAAPVVTVSIGTGLQESVRQSDVAALIEKADIAMYMAKEQGRNRVVHCDAATPDSAGAPV